MTTQNLFEVRPPNHEPHKMILCECCEKETIDYYGMLGWPLLRVRKATRKEAYDHVCLD